jgi:crossover junction endodeoxyribonuclease RuvC
MLGFNTIYTPTPQTAKTLRMAQRKKKAHTHLGLGIDPGLAATGFAVVGCLQRGGELCDWGAITTSSKTPPEKRLHEIYCSVRELIVQWQPDIIAIEDIYVLKTYPRAAIQLGEVKGIIALAAAEADIDYLHIKPAEVKHGLTGNGRAPKHQVSRAVQSSLGLAHSIKPEHASDAAAIALMALSRTGHYNW